MTAIPHKAVCVAFYLDDLAALDAFLDGCPGVNRSMAIRLALAACGVIPRRDEKVALPGKPGRPREFSQLVSSTFQLGVTLRGARSRNRQRVRERKRRGRMPAAIAGSVP